MLNRKNMFTKRKEIISKRIMKKMMIAFTAGVAGAVLAMTMPEQIQRIVQKRQEQTAVVGWWGTLYPKFCFSQVPEENKDQKDDIKISFWLAQALDW